MDWAEAAYGDLPSLRAAGRPYVAVNMVASADGAIAVDGRTAKLGGPSDHHLFHYLRSLADVILVGAQTVRAEHYGPPRVSDERQADRRARGQAPVPRVAIVSRSLDLDLDGPLFTADTSRPIVIVPEAADRERRAAVAAVAEVIVAGAEVVDLAAGLRALGELGATFVLCEGGPTVNHALARDDLIDELCLTIAPVFVGGSSGILSSKGLADLLELTLVHARTRDDDLFLRYRRADRSGSPADVAVLPGVDAFSRIVTELDYPMMVVTAGTAEERSGCLVGFGTQGSISPGRYVVLLSKVNHTFGVARDADVVAVHFLSSEDRHVAELFGSATGDEVDKFAQCEWDEGPLGVPILRGIARWFVGRVLDRVDTGDHVALVLDPIAGEAGPWPKQLGFQDVRDLHPGHPA
ncbi:MAG: pyrimidine reductase family protein [Acidobacteria bacterium]|nr:pyrimidine reductase family protein [Acidobacteriota bacterium]